MKVSLHSVKLFSVLFEKAMLLSYFSFFCTTTLLFSQAQDCYQEETNVQLLLAQPLCAQFGELPPDVVLINESSSNLSTNNLFNKVVHIHGKFTINTPTFNFTACKIKMGSGASIEVLQNNLVHFRSCKIFACDNMWKEILVKPNANIFMESSFVEDAQYAIHASINTPTFKVIGNEFNRNHVGILVDAKNFTPTVGYAFQVTGNTFDCRVNLIAPFPGQTPLPSNVTFAGMWLNNVPFINISSNTFIRQMIGVLSGNSYVGINSSTFTDIINKGTYESYQTGIGVSAYKNSFINQTGFGNGAGSTPSFNNCEEAAIVARGSYLWSSNNRVIDIGHLGICTESMFSKLSDIQYNRFEDNGGIPTSHMIKVQRSAFGNDKVNFNYISSNSNIGMSAIHVYDTYSSTGHCEVNGNELYINNGSTIGIDVHPKTGSNIEVNDNIFEVSNIATALNMFGGSAGTGGDNLHCSYNEIVASNTERGIWFTHIQNCMICSNQTDGSRSGILFTKFCGGSDTHTNIFNDHEIALLLQGNIGLGDEAHRGNKWLGTCFPGGTAAVHDGGDFSLSQFFIHDNDNEPQFCGNSDHLPTCDGTNASVFPMNGWFTLQQGAECNYDCPAPMMTNVGFELVEEETMGGNLANHGFSPAETWDAEAYLYRKLRNDSTLYTTGDDADLFLLSKGGSPMEGYFDIEQLVQLAFSPGDANQSGTLSTFSLIDGLMGLLGQTIESLYADPENTGLQLYAEELLGDIVDNKEILEQYIAGYEANRDIALASAVGMNNAISTSNLIESNIKFVFEKRLKGLSGDGLTETEMDELRVLAGKCYQVDGPGVRGAIGLLPSCEQPSYYNDDAACSPGAASPPPFNYVANNGQWSIYPVPTTNLLNIIAPSKTPEGATIEVIGSDGKVLQNARFSDIEKGQLDVSGIPKGIYFLKIHTEGAAPVSKKFIKIGQ